MESSVLDGGVRREFAGYLLNELNLSPLTAYTYESHLKRLERDLEKPAEEVSSRDVRTWMRTTTYNPSTKSGSLMALKSFHRWGVLEELWPPNGILGGPWTQAHPQPKSVSHEA